jgi:hypothetical protein
MVSLIVAAQLVSTLAMFGVIFFVQIVHYPLMARAGEEGFAGYARAHTDRTGLVVGPLMLAEMASSIWLAVQPPSPDLQGTAWVGLGLLIAIWGVTGLVSVPCHNRLAAGFDPLAHRRLVRTNWARTFLWAARVPVALALTGIIAP